MAFNTSPLRDIDDADRLAWQTDGVVCLRQVFDSDWIKSIEPVIRRVAVDGEDVGLIPTSPGRYVAHVNEDFRRFLFESPLGQAAGELMESKEIRFYFDEIFAKPPKSDSITLWHSDRMGWPVVGSMVPSLWIPMHDVAKDNSLEVILGSHRTDYPHWLFSPNARKMIRPEDRPKHPDEEQLRADPNNRFASWDMHVGDMLVVHPWLLHYSSGNSADDWRLATSIRVFGDDIRWAPRPDCVNLAGISFDEMVEGEPPAGPLFPLLWSEDGRKDDDSQYPRGFAATWTAGRRTDLNEDALFHQLLAKEA